MIKYEFCNQNIIDIHNSPYINNEHPIDVRTIFYNGYFCFIDTNKNIYDLDGFHIGSVDTGIKIKIYAKPIEILGETYYIDSTDRIYDKTGYYWGHFRDGMLVD
jgi:hypothetical protein